MDLDRNAIPTWFIQIVGLTAAIVFGVFSALSWSQAVKASYEAATANTIAMVTLCSSQNSTDTDPLGALCMSVTDAAQQSLSAVASSLFPSRTSTVPTATASGSPSGSLKPDTATTYFIIFIVPLSVVFIIGSLLAIWGPSGISPRGENFKF